MSKLESRICIIKQKIDRAIIIDRKRIKPISPFGIPFGNRKGLSFNLPITVEEVIKIENQYDLKFPTEYKAFITTIANGSSGPAYGLFTLEDSLKCSVVLSDTIKDKERAHLNFFKTPFVHTSAYNPDEDSYILELGNKCDRGELSQKKCDIVYDYLTAGTMILCHLGCGYYDRLVITGSTRGQIWADGDCSGQGYIPLNLSFLDWYEQWLDEHFS